MAISYISSGTAVYNINNPAPATPTHNVGDMLILTIGTKPDTTPATAPSGWTLLGSAAGGAGTQGNDTGPMLCEVYYRIADGGAQDSPGTITITNNNVSAAQVHVFRKTLDLWSIAGVGAADTSTGSPHSVTMPSNPGITTDDMLFTIGVVPTDVTTPSQFSDEAVSAPGLTMLPFTEIGEWDTADGQDMGGWLAYGPVTLGPATGNPTASANASGTTTNVAGPIFLVRMRELAITTVSASDTSSIAIADSSATSITEFVSKSASDTSSVAITESATVIDGYFTGGGSGTATVETWTFTQSTAQGTSITPTMPTGLAVDDLIVCIVPIDTNAISVTTPPSGYTDPSGLNPVEGTGGTPDERFYVYYKVAGAGETAPTITISGARDWTVIMVRVSGVDTAAPVEATAKIVSTTEAAATTASLPTVTTTNDNDLILAAMTADQSATFAPFATWPSPWAEHFDTENSVTFLGYTMGSYTKTPAGLTHAGPVTLSVSDRTARFILAIKPEAGGEWVFPDPKSASDSSSISISDSSSVATITAISASDTGSLAISDSGSVDESTKILPGSISGIEPETQGYVAPIMDTNGNLYRITESTLAESNQPKAMKSTDGGQTWVEQNAADRPGTDTGSIGDLESGWLTYETGGFMTFTWQRSFAAYSRFRTSDHPTNPDTWVAKTRENIASVTGAPQNMSHTSPTDQSYQWLFYQNGSDSSYRSRTSPGTYGTQGTIDTGTMGAYATIDSNNTSHILYKKSAQLHYKTLTSGGTLQGTSTRVDTNGINTTTPISHVRPVVYTSGSDVICTAIFINSSGFPRAVDVVNGTPGTEQAIQSSVVVLQNPGDTVNDSAVMSADVDGTTVHVMYADANGNVWHTYREYGGSWSTPVVVTDLTASDQAHWLYCRVNTYPDSTKVLSYTYDVGPHLDDAGNIKYDEVVLTDSQTPIAGSDTGSLAISESTSILISQIVSATDSSSVSIADTSQQAVSLATSDSSGLSISEAGSSSSTGSTTDTSSVSISESTELLGTQSRTDTGAISVSETATILVTVASSDNSEMSVTETTSRSNTLTASDTGSVSISDASATTLSPSASDTSSVSIAESSDVVTSGVTDKTASDTGSVSISETTSIAYSIVVSDTSSVAVSETAQLNSTETRTDTSSIAITESAVTVVSVSSTDTSALSISETRTQSATLASSDASTVAISESVNNNVSVSVVDSLSLVISESATNAVQMSSSDSAELASSETAVVSPITPSGINAYHGGVWVTGVVKVWVNNEWQEAVVKVYRNGVWV